MCTAGLLLLNLTSTILLLGVKVSCATSSAITIAPAFS
jgi:hypothetical protein